jgi:hypothetical protein
MRYRPRMSPRLIICAHSVNGRPQARSGAAANLENGAAAGEALHGRVEPGRAVARVAALRVRAPGVVEEVLVARAHVAVREARAAPRQEACALSKHSWVALAEETRDAQKPQASVQPHILCFHSRSPLASRGMPASSTMLGLPIGCIAIGPFAPMFGVP